MPDMTPMPTKPPPVMCACCGEREADEIYVGDNYELRGSHYSSKCLLRRGDGTSIVARILSRRLTQQAKPNTPPAVPLVEPFEQTIRWVNREIEKMILGSFTLDGIQSPGVVSISAPSCRSCSSPATHYGYCAYCCDRAAEPNVITYAASARSPANQAAALRMQKQDARERPRSTASSRELAKPHPWPSAGDDEP